ncbi:MAG: hypothetical protein HYV60_06355, partial [Planctomycetia bacterium]|nr:hypothetical protein [Planctomycetia bacterium]
MSASETPLSHEEQFRNELLDALERELVGPDHPPHGVVIEPGQIFIETLEESPTQRYSAGVLFPQSQPLNEIEVTDESTGEEPNEDPDAGLDDEEQAAEAAGAGSVADSMSDAYDETVRLANEYLPSAIGMSCLCEIPDAGVTIRATAARYESQKPADPESRRTQEWRRIELQLPEKTLRIAPDTDHGIEPFEFDEKLQLRAIYRHRGNGVYLVTFSLINTNTGDPDARVRAADCFFQVGLAVKSVDGSHAFHEYKVLGRVHDVSSDNLDQMEEASLELLYRKRKAFAVGHGTSVDWSDESGGKVKRIATATVPRVKVPPVEPRSDGGDELSMYFLSGGDNDVRPNEIPTVLERLAADYESWINEKDIAELPTHLRGVAEENLKQCNECLRRVRRGITLLTDDKVLLEAFMLANRAILMQQVHSKRPKRPTKKPLRELPTNYKPVDDKTGRWRSFQ